MTGRRTIARAAAVFGVGLHLGRPCRLSFEPAAPGSGIRFRRVDLPGAPETVVAFNTDVAHLGRFARKLLVGPGSILVAHGAEERVQKAELHAAVGLYRRAVLQLRAFP